jgi:hypothetical protein
MTVQPAQLQSNSRQDYRQRPAARGVPDRGEIVSCPSGGQIEARHLQRPGALFVGTYDCEVSEAMLLEDLRAAGAGAE